MLVKVNESYFLERQASHPVTTQKHIHWRQGETHDQWKTENLKKRCKPSVAFITGERWYLITQKSLK